MSPEAKARETIDRKRQNRDLLNLLAIEPVLCVRRATGKTPPISP